jgi:hypothetical protein
MHNFIVRPPEGLEVDHIDRDGLNNQRGNYRLCTRAQNTYNRGPYKTGLVEYKGVSPYTCGQYSQYGPYFKTQIRTGDHHLVVGSYSTPEKAALAFNMAAAVVHGEFAYLNTVPESAELTPKESDRVNVRLSKFKLKLGR